MDPEVIKVLETVGFPLWAVVVLWVGLSISKNFNSLRKEFSEWRLDMETRIATLEAIVKLDHDKISRD